MFFDFEQRSGVSFACICRQKALNVSGSARSNSLFAYYHPYSDSFPNIGSTSPCVRRQAMQAGKFLRRVTIFLFCCFHLPSIVWICFFFHFAFFFRISFGHLKGIQFYGMVEILSTLFRTIFLDLYQIRSCLHICPKGKCV